MSNHFLNISQPTIWLSHPLSPAEMPAVQWWNMSRGYDFSLELVFLYARAEGSANAVRPFGSGINLSDLDRSSYFLSIIQPAAVALHCFTKQFQMRYCVFYGEHVSRLCTFPADTEQHRVSGHLANLSTIFILPLSLFWSPPPPEGDIQLFSC